MQSAPRLIDIFAWSRDEIAPATPGQDHDPSFHPPPPIAPASRYRNAPVLAGQADSQLSTYLATDRPGMGMSSLHRSWRSTPSRL